MTTYLDRIIAAHRIAAAAERRPLEALLTAALSMPAPRDFGAALAGEAGLSIIAEVKRSSPSKGPLDEGLDPAALAREYRAGGAVCLSVLTDRDHFGGSPADLVAARDASGLPVLRKDFTVGAADVCDSRLMGADAVLLIVAALTDAELGELVGLAGRLCLGALVEVHDEAELDRALTAGASMVGVNQRDLHTFEVDPRRAARLRPLIPAGVVAVAESGIASPDDARRLAGLGYDAALVGEALIRSADRAAAVAALCGSVV
ncbi:MAG: indole-3-glycerol phosphate synthase TrpC [Acidimicrobiales bacterium]